MLNKFLLILLFSIIFNGCSNKNDNVIIHKQEKEVSQQNKKSEDTFDNEFASEFDNEFKIEKTEIFDPLSGYNRVMTSFNDGVYTYFLNPVAKGYKVVVPEKARIGVSNFFDNLLFPVRFVNNLLQLKFKNSADELGRFVINTTIGLLGFMDPATEHFGIKEHKEDFGQTLGYWGVGSGPHIVLPFLGPSNLRDTLGFLGDGYSNPLSTNSPEDIRISNNDKETFGIKMFESVNKTSLHLGEYENLKKDAIDLYPFLRDIYEQRRKKLIEE